MWGLLHRVVVVVVVVVVVAVVCVMAVVAQIYWNLRLFVVCVKRGGKSENRK
jgi:hypothetical protein